MNIPGRPSRNAREHLLGGGQLPGDPVSELLAAASEPGRPDELAGLPAALAAFRLPAARRPGAAGAGRGTRRIARVMTSGALLTKVLAGAAAAAAVGGIAVAAGTGGPAGPASSQHTLGAPATSGTDPGQVGSPTHPASDPTARSGGAAPASTAVHAPVPSLGGLCTAWRAHMRHADPDHGSWQHSAAFSVLVSAAGGTAGVPAYCARFGPRWPTPSTPTAAGTHGHGPPCSGPPRSRPSQAPPHHGTPAPRPTLRG